MSPPRTGETFVCIMCNTSFYRTRSEIKRNRTKFCGKKCAGDSRAGEENNNWKGGFHITQSGYKRLANRKYEHRQVMENYLGRELKNNECVHHKDHDKLNNDISNLELLTYKQHAAIHAKDERCNPDELVELRKQGLSAIEIGEITGHNPGTIWRILARWQKEFSETLPVIDNRRYLTFQNKTLTIKEWSDIVGLKPSVILKRLYRGWDVEKTLMTPLQR